MSLDIQSVIGEDSQRGEGAWVDYPDEDGVSFKLAYLGNDSYQDFVSERMMRARKGRRDIPAEKQRAIITQGLVKFVLKGWKGLTSSGQPFEFTPENAKTVLEKSSVLRNWIIEEANSLDNFGGGEKDDEEEAGSPNGDIKSGPPVDA